MNSCYGRWSRVGNKNGDLNASTPLYLQGLVFVKLWDSWTLSLFLFGKIHAPHYLRPFNPELPDNRSPINQRDKKFSFVTSLRKFQLFLSQFHGQFRPTSDPHFAPRLLQHGTFEEIENRGILKVAFGTPANSTSPILHFPCHDESNKNQAQK